MSGIDHEARFLQLAGADNVRDLGGLPARDGRRTRTRRLLRGEFTPGLTAADIELLVREIGLRTVVDLRSPREVADEPGGWAGPDVGIVHCPLPLVQGELIPGESADLLTLSIGFLEADPEPLASAVRALVAPVGQPALFHCAAGKDRTGAVSAIVLDLLGVPREVIAQDYALTSARLDRVFARLSATDFYREHLRGVSPESRSAVPATILAFLDVLDERYGGAEAWVAEHGVGRDALEGFRAAMLLDV